VTVVVQPRGGTGDASAVEERLLVIDTDTHPVVRAEDLPPYLPRRWREYLEMMGLRGHNAMGLRAGNHPSAARSDAWSPAGDPPGTDPAFFCAQLLDFHGVDIALANTNAMQLQTFMGPGQPIAFIDALMRATNEWKAERWLDFDPRLRGAISLPIEDPTAALRELERCAADERFVHILLPFRTIDPLGNPRYWWLFEAATAMGLPISLHPAAQHVITGAGWPSFYFEDHTGLPAALFSQMASLIAEGALDRFPDLRITFLEGGWSWAAPFAWRMDRAWRTLRSEIAHVELAPSEYVRRNFWFATQPIEEPERPEHFQQVFDQFVDFGLVDKLMFSTDYPHWDFDDPDKALPPTIPLETKRQVYNGNALRCYPRLASAPGVG
jgi:predicted TIM-barrel fold metal-dependent hydrolase